jgi:hypothetical protein
MRYRNIAAALCLLLVSLPAVAMAQTVKPNQQYNSNSVWFDNWIGLSNANMRVATPDGDIIDVFAERGSPVFVLRGRTIADGVYRYELRAATQEKVKNRNYDKDSVTGNDTEYYAKQLYITGSFMVKRGVIVAPEAEDGPT